jgi:hypothetical protein
MEATIAAQPSGRGSYSSSRSWPDDRPNRLPWAQRNINAAAHKWRVRILPSLKSALRHFGRAVATMIPGSRGGSRWREGTLRRLKRLLGSAAVAKKTGACPRALRRPEELSADPRAASRISGACGNADRSRVSRRDNRDGSPRTPDAACPSPASLRGRDCPTLCGRPPWPGPGASRIT